MARNTDTFPWNPWMFSSAWLSGSPLMRASWDTWQAVFTISTTAPQVIAMRLVDLGTGPTPKNQKEMIRMVSEKMAAATESGQILTTYFLTLAQSMPLAMVDPVAAERLAKKSAVAAKRSLTPYRRRVQANAKRLARD